MVGGVSGTVLGPEDRRRFSAAKYQALHSLFQDSLLEFSNMILDSKSIPPPPYFPPSRSAPAPTLPTLPPHILLHIIYLTFPQFSLPDAPKVALQRKTLYWLATSLRLVDRTLYASCMHVLRSTHIPAYDALVRPPYSSDPFPLLAPPAPAPTHTSPYSSASTSSALSLETTSPLQTLQRETFILDKFIALKVREDVWTDDSELHLERDDAYKDLFYHAQPRARLEDLVRVYGIQRGVVCVGPPPVRSPAGSSTPASMSSVTLVPSPAPYPEEQDTESKPRLFPPGSPYNTLPSSSSPSSSPISPTYSPPYSPITSSSSLSLTNTNRPRPARKQSTSFLSSIFSKSKSRTPPASSSSSSNPSPYAPTRQPQPIPIANLTITFAPRSAALVLHPARRTIVSTPRARNESLEDVAMRLVGLLEGWVREGG